MLWIFPSVQLNLKGDVCMHLEAKGAQAVIVKAQVSFEEDLDYLL